MRPCGSLAGASWTTEGGVAVRVSSARARPEGRDEPAPLAPAFAAPGLEREEAADLLATSISCYAGQLGETRSRGRSMGWVTEVICDEASVTLRVAHACTPSTSPLEPCRAMYRAGLWIRF